MAEVFRGAIGVGWKPTPRLNLQTHRVSIHHGDVRFIGWRRSEPIMQKRSGSYARLFYHFVWSTKCRAPIIDVEVEASLKEIFSTKAEELDIEIVESNSTADHVHVLVKSKSTLAPADIAKNLKGASFHFVNHVVLRQDRFRSLYWQDGYGVVSVSPGSVRSIKKYIRNQKEHHASNELIEDFEGLSNMSDDVGVG
jgi:putative transposase